MMTSPTPYNRDSEIHMVIDYDLINICLFPWYTGLSRSSFKRANDSKYIVQSKSKIRKFRAVGSSHILQAIIFIHIFLWTGILIRIIQHRVLVYNISLKLGVQCCQSIWESVKERKSSFSLMKFKDTPLNPWPQWTQKWNEGGLPRQG